MARARAGVIERERMHRAQVAAAVATFEREIRSFGATTATDLFDPVANAQAALNIYRAGGPWGGVVALPEWRLDGVKLYEVEVGFTPASSYEVGELGPIYWTTLEPGPKWYGRARERWWLLLWALKHPRGMWREWRDR